MKRCHAFVAFALAFAAAVALALPARAQTTSYDQQYTGGTNSTGGANRTLGQSFTPTASAMNTASFFLNVTDFEGTGDTVTFYVQVLSGDGLGGTVLGTSADVTVAQTSNVNAYPEVPFRFPTTVALTHNSVYTLALMIRSTTGQSPNVSVEGNDTDSYAGGQCYNGQGIVDLDFREGIIYPDSLIFVHSFAGPDGNSPQAGLIQDNAGNLDGTAEEGGAHGDGTVFKVSTDGTTFTTLHDFDVSVDGTYPSGGLLQASDGNFYSDTAGNVSGPYQFGTVFELSTDGTTFGTLHAFSEGNDGEFPYTGLIQGNDGYLYGITNEGGANGGGTVFKVSTDGTTFQVLHSFSQASSTDPKYPDAALLQASDGFLYGTTDSGGANGRGTVFKLSTDGTAFQVLHAFGVNDGAGPDGALIQGSDGNLYGITALGTSTGSTAVNDGTVFKLSTDGTAFQTLHAFTDGDGRLPGAGLLQASDGNLYGTTQDGGVQGIGTVFMVSTDGTAFATLYGFGSVNTDGRYPEAVLLQASDGNLYGTASEGGANGGGEVYEVPVRLPDVVQFHQAINSVNETAGTAMVRVDRIGDNGAPLLVASYSSSDGTAIAGTDYTAPNSPLVWTQGDTAPKFISVPITNRGFTDGSLRTLSLALSNVVSGSTNAISLGYPATATLTINGSIPGAPVITSANTAAATQGKAFSPYQITASATPNSYGASGLPAGLSVDPTSGLISGMPTVSGSFPVTLSATNAKGTGSATLNLSVTGVAPTITSAKTATAATNAAFSYQITATNTPTSFAATGLPTGLTLDTSTGLITGMPINEGTSAVTLSATNNTGTAMARLTISISAPPAITSNTSVQGGQAMAFAYQITATNSPTSFAAPGLPTGLSLNTSTGLISGTPVNNGVAAIEVSATNATGTGTTRVTFSISVGPPVIISDTTASATQGQPFNYQIVARNTPTSYAANGLPTGLTLNTSTGEITGSPINAGKSAVTLSATDQAGTGTAKLTITIAAH